MTLPAAEATAGYRLEEGVFPGKGGTLYRRSALPSGAAWARLGILHGYGDHSGRFRHVMEWMAGQGVACHALDFRGHGHSSGRRGFVTRWDEYLSDLQTFLSLDPLSTSAPTPPLPHSPTLPPLFLLGHSHGALVLAAAALKGLPPVAGCIFTCPYFRSRMVVPRIKVLLGQMLNPVFPWLPIPAGLRHDWMSSDEAMIRESHEDPLIIHTATPRWYLGCLEAQEEVTRRAEELRLPFLMLVGERDPVSDPRTARDFFDRARSRDKTYHAYPSYLHEILREAGREEVFARILDWMRARSPQAASLHPEAG